MGILTDLKSIQEKSESRRGEGSNDLLQRELTRNIATGSKRNIQLLQEIDRESKLFNEELGAAVVVQEYQHPDLWWLKIADADNDFPWAAEQGWKDNITLYINVVDIDTGEVFYLARSIFGGLGKQIVDSAVERGKITDIIWSIGKSGSKLKTTYKLTPKDMGCDPYEIDVEDSTDEAGFIDLKKVIRFVPSDEQEALVRQIEARVRAKQQETASDEVPASTDDEDDDAW